MRYLFQIFDAFLIEAFQIIQRGLPQYLTDHDHLVTAAHFLLTAVALSYRRHWVAGSAGEHMSTVHMLSSQQDVFLWDVDLRAVDQLLENETYSPHINGLVIALFAEDNLGSSVPP